MLRTDEMNDDIGNNKQTEQTSGHTKRVETTGDKRGRKKNQRKDTVSESEKNANRDQCSGMRAAVA